MYSRTHVLLKTKKIVFIISLFKTKSYIFVNLNLISRNQAFVGRKWKRLLQGKEWVTFYRISYLCAHKFGPSHFYILTRE